MTAVIWAGASAGRAGETLADPGKAPAAATCLNLQPKGSSAKAYQVKQVRNVIITHKLEGPSDEA
jgi:hypothetical protein